MRQVRRGSCRVRRIFLLGMPVAVLGAVFLCGCVRLAGTAGYAKVNADGETTVKQASFDTSDYIPESPAPGNITTS